MTFELAPLGTEANLTIKKPMTWSVRTSTLTFYNL